MPNDEMEATESCKCLPYSYQVEFEIGDCLEVMRGLADNSFDAIITDPPFGIGFEYGSFKDMTTSEDYWGWFEPRYIEMLRLLKPGGFCAIWQTQVNFKHFWDWFGDDIHIYASCKNFVQVRHTPIQYAYDPIVMFYKSGREPLHPESPARSMDFFVADTASRVCRSSNPEKGHPCPRPLDQVIEIIENFVVKDGRVLDPFLGSGTTLVACLRTGRRGFGIEIDRTYLPIIERRLLDASSKIEDYEEKLGGEKDA
jgi:site-specific DNA-methyltransferase (adenine-specific)